MFDPVLLITAISLMVILTVLVAVHELGHYLAAKMFGMEVEAFAIMLGGVRKTNLKPYLEKPLVSGWIVAGVWIGSVALWEVFQALQIPIGTAAMQVVAVMVVPLWIASRLAALYHADFNRIAQRWLTAWLLWFFVITFAGVTAGKGITGFIPLLTPISAIALLMTYYLPVGKREEEDQYGIGHIKAGNDQVQVRYRPLLSHTTKAGTEFSLLVLPLGGFAKIKGMQPREDGSETRIPGGFFSKPPWQRFIVLFAGPLFSILAGIAIFAGLFMTYGMPTDEPLIGGIAKDSAAEAAGLQKGDMIVSLDGRPMETSKAVRDYVVAKGVEPIKIVVKRAGQPVSVTATPRITVAKSDPTAKPTPLLGVAFEMPMKRLPAGEAFVAAVRQPIEFVTQFAGMFKEPSRISENVGGIGTVAAITDSAVRSDRSVETRLFIAAMLSISLGVFNLLPIYPLDGGQMLVAVMEMLRGGRRLSMRVQSAISGFGFMLICMLILFVLVNDARRLSSGEIIPSDPKAQSQKK